MEAFVDTNPMTGNTKVWLYSPIGIGPDTDVRYLRYEGDGKWSDIVQPMAVEAPAPTFELPRQAAEALASALATMGRPEEATQRHLTDAIKVRDRLLTMLEKA
jgi:hypothetical protein